MWQYMSWGRGRKYGVCSMNVDLDVFNGTVDDMQAWCGAVSPPAEAGCTFRVLTDGLRVRTGPGTQYPVTGHLAAGERVHVERIAGDAAWAQIAPERFAAVTYRGRRHMEMVSDE